MSAIRPLSPKSLLTTQDVWAIRSQMFAVRFCLPNKRLENQVVPRCSLWGSAIGTGASNMHAKRNEPGKTTSLRAPINPEHFRMPCAVQPGLFSLYGLSVLGCCSSAAAPITRLPILSRLRFLHTCLLRTSCFHETLPHRPR